MIALFGWDASGVTAGATVALGLLAAVSIVANGLLVRASIRQAKSAEQQRALTRNELLLVQRQVAVMERTAELQENDAARRVREAFPELEASSLQLGAHEVRGVVRYVRGTDPAEDVEVRVWFRGRQYGAELGRIIARADGVGFRATPLDATEQSEPTRIPGWALTRGPRVDAVSWLGSGGRGRWWAQRYNEQQEPFGLPDQGGWDRLGMQQPTSVA